MDHTYLQVFGAGLLLGHVLTVLPLWYWLRSRVA